MYHYITKMLNYYHYINISIISLPFDQESWAQTSA